MAPRPPGRSLTRLLGLLALAGFVATGPGTSGLEVVYHLSGGGAEQHARGIHLEPAGGGAHSDHCRLGLSASDGRLPSSVGTRVRTVIVGVALPSSPVSLPAARGDHELPLSRAPPPQG